MPISVSLPLPALCPTVSACPLQTTPHVRVNGRTVAGPSVSSEADGALAGEPGPWARAAGRVGVTPMTADVARVLEGIRGAICEGGDIDPMRIQKRLQATSSSREQDRTGDQETCGLLLTWSGISKLHPFGLMSMFIKLETGHMHSLASGLWLLLCYSCRSALMTETA